MANHAGRHGLELLAAEVPELGVGRGEVLAAVVIVRADPARLAAGVLQREGY